MEGAVRHLLQKDVDALRPGQHGADVAQAVVPVGGEVAEGQQLFDVDDGVDAEAAQPLVQPPVDHLVDLPAQRGIFPVQIRLLAVEGVEVDLILVARQQIPAGAAEIAAPVAGQLLPRMPVPDVEELPVGAVGVGAGPTEPLVLVGAVVHHQIHHDGDAPLLALGDELVHVRHGAEPGVDAVIVGDIIALIGQGGAVDGGEPHDLHPQLLQVVQLGDDAPQIADAVAVGVAEALGVDLIGGFAVPPFSFHGMSAS